MDDYACKLQSACEWYAYVVDQRDKLQNELRAKEDELKAKKDESLSNMFRRLQNAAYMESQVSNMPSPRLGMHACMFLSKETLAT